MPCEEDSSLRQACRQLLMRACHEGTSSDHHHFLTHAHIYTAPSTFLEHRISIPMVRCNLHKQVNICLCPRPILAPYQPLLNILGQPSSEACNRSETQPTRPCLGDKTQHVSPHPPRINILTIGEFPCLGKNANDEVMPRGRQSKFFFSQGGVWMRRLFQGHTTALPRALGTFKHGFGKKKEKKKTGC